MKKTSKKIIYLVASGDSRLSANQVCESAQQELEKKILSAIEREEYVIRRAHGFDKDKKHGFIDSQSCGMEVFQQIPKDAPVIVAEAVWQYSHHVLAGLFAHHGPILTVANWSGTWPGLVGMLNLNGSLTKAGVKYSTLWSEDFTDAVTIKKLRNWLATGKIKHDVSHVTPLSKISIPREVEAIGVRFAREFRQQQHIMGVFDEGCMGMYNAIIPDALLHSTGVFKERLSQSALYAKTLTIPDQDAQAVYQWYLDRGVKFQLGSREETELTERQILLQCKTYIAAVRLADEFGCSTIGIQYQQGLKDLLPASDLVEGTLNNVIRPPVYHEKTGKELFKGNAIPHFNEVDECAGLDGLVIYKLWKEKLDFPPENTLHDLRWGRHYCGSGLDAYVWVFEISGAVPPAHFTRGWKDVTSERQPPMYFRLGGGTIKGVSKPGWVVWSRIFVADGKLNYDTGLAEVVALPVEETEERLRLTTSQWPIMHAVLQGVIPFLIDIRYK